jgi:two-component system cell cycle sensor histidine kinase/response regulator CckA
MDEAEKRKRAQLAELEAEMARLRAELGSDEQPQSPSACADHAAAPAAGLLRTGLSKRELLLVEAERVAHLGSWTWDLRSDEIAWSDEFFRILGVDPRVQPSTTAFYSAIHPEDRARVQAVAQRGLLAEEMIPVEFRIVQPGGALREVRMEAALMHDAEGRQTHVVGTVLDITEARRSARLLARAVTELNEAHHSAGLGSWRWDAATSQLEWSEGMFRLLGLPTTLTPTDELFFQHVHSDDRELVRVARQHDLAGQEPEPHEFRVVQADGKVLDVVQRAVAQWSQDGSMLGFRGVIQDITERKALEEQLRHSQKMEAVGTLAGGVAHDFNNYLMVIAGYTDLLREQLPVTDPARESVDAIAEAYQRCAHLTQQLLTLSRKRTAKSTTVDLSALVAGTAPLLRSVLGERMLLRLELEPEGMLIQADPLQVEQALMNLVVNARDAMPQGGELTVRVQAQPDRSADRKLVRLSVADAGCGIPHELRSRIYEPFFTTKEVGQGTGLGLSTVYAIVRDACARIDFESEPGRGTTFHIDWPRCDAPLAAAPKSAPPRDKAPVTGRSILVVEDVARVRDLLVAQLERAGYRVKCAAHGMAALELLAQQPVDLVLSDMVMPQLGGVELVQTVRVRYPDVRCLLMTGYSADALQGGEPNVGPMLRKPFTAIELLQAVERAFGVK